MLTKFMNISQSQTSVPHFLKNISALQKLLVNLYTMDICLPNKRHVKPLLWNLYIVQFNDWCLPLWLKTDLDLLPNYWFVLFSVNYCMQGNVHLWGFFSLLSPCSEFQCLNCVWVNSRLDEAFCKYRRPKLT